VWLFLSRRLRAYVLLALGAPLVAWALDALGRRIEARRGATRVSRVLRWGGRRLRRKARGPLRHTGEDVGEHVDVASDHPGEPGYARTAAAQQAHSGTRVG
jgi:hypothetical protein